MHSPLQKARDIFLFNSELSRKEITSGKKCFFSYICCFIQKTSHTFVDAEISNICANVLSR